MRAAGIHNAQQESGWIWAHVSGAPEIRLAPLPDRRSSTAEAAAFEACLSRREDREPLQYILGSTAFYGLDLVVGPGVLIPRPETERLVEIALGLPLPAGPLCDVCTGSGAIALALAHELAAPVDATDVSAEALDYARLNRERLGLDRVTLYEGDLLEPLPPGRTYALITANPPYVAPEAFDALPREVRDHEPRNALWAADGGLAVLEHLARTAPARLRPGGWLVCEIGDEQGAAADALLDAAGLAAITVHRDYCDRDRVVVGRTQPSNCGDQP